MLVLEDTCLKPVLILLQRQPYLNGHYQKEADPSQSLKTRQTNIKHTIPDQDSKSKLPLKTRLLPDAISEQPEDKPLAKWAASKILLQEQ